jgi:hypothetical protein
LHEKRLASTEDEKKAEHPFLRDIEPQGLRRVVGPGVREFPRSQLEPALRRARTGLHSDAHVLSARLSAVSADLAGIVRSGGTE